MRGGIILGSREEPALPSVPTLSAGPAHQSSAITMETGSRLPIGGREGRGRGGDGWLFPAHPLDSKAQPSQRPSYRGSGAVGDPCSPQS